MPDFIGIGSGKCGTTWIYEMITSHPGVHKGHAKELNFFNSNMQYYERGLEWYETHFRNANGKVSGEFSVSYLYDCIAIQRIATHYPEAKIILAIRDPIDRAVSDFHHSKRKGIIPQKLKFQEYIETHYDLSHGKYVGHIKKLYDFFPKEQVLIIPYDLIGSHPILIINKLYDHLALDKNFLPMNYRRLINKGFSPKIPILETSMTKFSAWLTRNGSVDLLNQMKKLKLHELVRHFNYLPKEICASDPAIAREWALNQCLDPDPRITKMGRWLRRTKLDELPQIWNILRGDMSFVGPRPFLPSQQPIYAACDEAQAYYALRPGVTGPWQLDRNRDKRFVTRALYDARYIREANAASDAGLLLRTALVPLKSSAS